VNVNEILSRNEMEEIKKVIDINLDHIEFLVAPTILNLETPTLWIPSKSYQASSTPDGTEGRKKFSIFGLFIFLCRKNLLVSIIEGNNCLTSLDIFMQKYKEYQKHSTLVKINVKNGFVLFHDFTA